MFRLIRVCCMLVLTIFVLSLSWYHILTDKKEEPNWCSVGEVVTVQYIPGSFWENPCTMITTTAGTYRLYDICPAKVGDSCERATSYTWNNFSINGKRYHIKGE